MKRKYTFGDKYVLRQIRLGYVTYELFPGHSVIVRVRGAAPLIIVKDVEWD